MVIEVCLRCGATGYQPTHQHPMQVVMQDEYAHICSACGFTWPRKGRDEQYQKRYGEPIWPYEKPTASDVVLRGVVKRQGLEVNVEIPTTYVDEYHGPNWCGWCGKDTATIAYNLWKTEAERRCGVCGRPKVLSPES